MQAINDFLISLHNYLGGHHWFVALLLGTGIFFTFYLRFPQIRYFRHSLRVVRGKYDKASDAGDTTHFQALATALSGTVGTGNIAGVALAVHLGGPAALFWMLVTAFLGMCTKYVEVTLSHKYRDFDAEGMVAGGPMYYMKKKLNFRLKSGKTIQTGHALGAFFAVAVLFSTFGTGSLPQINSISNSVFTSFGIKHIYTGAVLALLMALIIIGGIKRIAKVTEKLVPFMAVIYFLGAIVVILSNVENFIPSLIAVFSDAFNGTAAVGGFLGASFAFALNSGVNRGLFSNEAGQGSAPIAHASARTSEPVSEGMVAILEPFIDTIIICMLTGMTLLSSGVWKEKHMNVFHYTDIEVLAQNFDGAQEADVKKLQGHINKSARLPLFSGEISVNNGKIENDIAVLHARSLAENISIKRNNSYFSGKIKVSEGKIDEQNNSLVFEGKSLIHSAPLTNIAFTKSVFGKYGGLIVTIGLLLFAFSTALAWSYYGDRAITYLFGVKWVLAFRVVFVAAFFVASFIDTTIIWNLSLITIVFMTVPNLIGLLILHRDVKESTKSYWEHFKKEFPEG